MPAISRSMVCMTCAYKIINATGAYCAHPLRMTYNILQNGEVLAPQTIESYGERLIADADRRAYLMGASVYVNGRQGCILWKVNDATPTPP